MKTILVYSAFSALVCATLATAGLGQAPTSPTAQPKTPDFSPDTPALYAAAIAKVNQDPDYIKAMEAVRKAQKAADEMLYAKLRKLEPRLKAYADYLEELRYPKPPAGMEAKQ